MKKLSFLALVAGLVVAFALTACDKKSGEPGKEAGQATSGEIAWMGYDEGMAKAKETGKPVMVDFYTDWCKYCKDLDNTTYKDPAIVGMLNSDFICIKVNAEGTASATEGGKKMTEKELAAEYQVTGFPTLWFFDVGCKKIGALPGFQTAEQLKPVLTYITSGSCAKGTPYEEYIKTVQPEQK